FVVVVLVGPFFFLLVLLHLGGGGFEVLIIFVNFQRGGFFLVGVFLLALFGQRQGSLSALGLAHPRSLQKNPFPGRHLAGGFGRLGPD
ncbi:hypothetical protein, partial [Pseudomonas marginalis]|uniref:hypothetical protein n=1 Tax=Pseudomonas marginalis TaxID=298 RepID=UPI0034D709AA